MSIKITNGGKNRGTFYVALAVCITALAVAGFITLRNSMQHGSVVDDSPDNPDLASYSYSTPVLPELTESGANNSAGNSGKVTSAAATSANSANSATSAAGNDDGVQVMNPEKVTASGKYIMPVQGDVITPYSPDTLLLSKTMNDWRTHAGMDIKGNVGAKVKCSNDGTVDKIYEDPLLGWTVEVKHSDGVVTRYSNLSSSVNVTAGKKVKAGDTIGGIGQTAASEGAMESHLHFEALKDGKNIDPKSLMK